MKRSINPNVSVAFSGPGLQTIFPKGYDAVWEEKIRKSIFLTVQKLYNEGYANFIVGMEPGFHFWAAETVAAMKASPEYEKMTLACVIPFVGHRQLFDKNSITQYDKIMDAGDFHTILAPKYHPRYHRGRDDWMLDHSTALVCYYYTKVAFTLQKAYRGGHKVIYLLDSLI